MSARALSSVTEDILRHCPRFRVLLVGKSGVGKSHFINHAFNVGHHSVRPDAFVGSIHNDTVLDYVQSVSERERGICDINEEITSPQNSRFVVHDSQGFEHGEVSNLETVKKFLGERGQDAVLKDRS